MYLRGICRGILLHKIREEKSFDSLEELVAQLNKDKKFVKNQNMPKIKV